MKIARKNWGESCLVPIGFDQHLQQDLALLASSRPLFVNLRAHFQLSRQRFGSANTTKLCIQGSHLLDLISGLHGQHITLCCRNREMGSSILMAFPVHAAWLETKETRRMLSTCTPSLRVFASRSLTSGFLPDQSPSLDTPNFVGKGLDKSIYDLCETYDCIIHLYIYIVGPLTYTSMYIEGDGSK